jgi:thioredoxin-related protein
MKNIISYILISSLFACQFTQNKEYLSKISTLPLFDFLLTDSNTLVHTKNIPNGKPILLIYFRPDCPYSQAEVRNILKNISKFNGVQIYLLTGASITNLKLFIQAFRVDQYPKNIVVGKDFNYSFIHIFRPRSVPFLVVYNEHRTLVRVYHGEIPFANLLKVING